MSNTIQPQTTLENVMFAVKRIEAFGGSRAWVGTGYAFSIADGDSSFIPLIITNRHVAQGAETMRILFHMAVNGNVIHENTYLTITQQNSIVVFHPDPAVDLAAISVAPAMNAWTGAQPDQQLHWMAVRDDDLLNDAQLAELDACQQVVMVGCPSGLWDERNGFPIFRRGVTATHPAIDFEGRPEFVIDIGVYSGSSGSPVFLVEQGLIPTMKASGTWTPGSRFGLMGTLWGGPRITESGELVVEPAPTDARVGVQTAVRMHLGYVIKARELKRLIEHFKVQLDAIRRAAPTNLLSGSTTTGFGPPPVVPKVTFNTDLK